MFINCSSWIFAMQLFHCNINYKWLCISTFGISYVTPLLFPHIFIFPLYLPYEVFWHFALCHCDVANARTNQITASLANDSHWFPIAIYARRVPISLRSAAVEMGTSFVSYCNNLCYMNTEWIMFYREPFVRLWLLVGRYNRGSGFYECTSCDINRLLVNKDICFSIDRKSNTKGFLCCNIGKYSFWA